MLVVALAGAEFDEGSKGSMSPALGSFEGKTCEGMWGFARITGRTKDMDMFSLGDKM